MNKPLKLKDIKPPVTITWTRWLSTRGSASERGRVIEKKGRNLLIDRGGVEDWLWWPTINRYNDVRVVALADGEEDA